MTEKSDHCEFSVKTQQINRGRHSCQENHADHRPISIHQLLRQAGFYVRQRLRENILSLPVNIFLADRTNEEGR